MFRNQWRKWNTKTKTVQHKVNAHKEYLSKFHGKRFQFMYNFRCKMYNVHTEAISGGYNRWCRWHGAQNASGPNVKNCTLQRWHLTDKAGSSRCCVRCIETFAACVGVHIWRCTVQSACKSASVINSATARWKLDNAEMLFRIYTILYAVSKQLCLFCMFVS